MLKNYIKIAWRNLLKNKGYTAIHIFGLALGSATAIFIFGYISFERSFDTFHPDSNSIYRLIRSSTYSNGETDLTPGSPLAFQQTLMRQHPELGEFVPVHGILGPQITVMKNATTDGPQKFLEEDDGICAGPEFFKVFNFPWILGSPVDLEKPQVIAISKELAEKYFGTVQQAMGSYLKINNLHTLQVVGILENPPLHTDLRPNLVISYATKKANPEDWGWSDFEDWGSTSSNDHLFLKLAPNQTKESVDQVLAAFTHQNYTGRQDNDKKAHYLKELSTVHFDPEVENFNYKTISETKLQGTALIGVLIILMACFNFINISTAIAQNRVKEIGVRKVLGSLKRQVSFQFLIETFLLVSIALLLGIGIAIIGTPFFEEIFDLPPDFELFATTNLLPYTFLVLICITLLSGVYPAIFMASFSPLQAFNAKSTSSWKSGISLRKVLVIVQFSVTIFLIFSTLVNVRQLDFLAKKDMGYKKEGVYTFFVDPELKVRYEALKSGILAIPEIKSLSYSSDSPSSSNNWQSNFFFDYRSEQEPFNTSIKMVDQAYFETFGLTLIAGKIPDFSDTAKYVVVNETMLEKLGAISPIDAIGKGMKIGGNTKWWSIAAVVKDFKTGSAKEATNPIVLFADKNMAYQCSVKMQSKNLSSTISKLKEVHDATFPEYAFSGEFYEDTIAEFYDTEQRQGLLYKSASLIAIFIACLGLVGMAAFTVLKRKKEIGVRKVMGASLVHILSILTRDFLILLGVAALIGLPAAWYLSNQWLQDFLLRIEVGWTYFAVTLLLVSTLVILSISYHALNSALSNPVKSLRSE